MTGTRRSYGRRWLDAARHPARRDGAVLWALLVLPWVAGLVLARRHHLDAGGWGVVLTVSIGMSTLWVTWAPFRDARRSAAAESGPGLPRVADELAAVVGRQWGREAAVRRLNDPYPLPVSWTAAAAGLAASWKSLTELAATGAGWPQPALGRAWAGGPNELAGKGDDLVEVLAKVPTGRLAVLGEPGSGKTMLMVRLVLDLLAGRTDGGPVPVLAPLASWDPSVQDLNGWLATRLITDYPGLAGPPPVGVGGPTQAAALLEAGLILPVLDGLDELPGPMRGVAIGRINDALPPGGQVLVTCRTRQYWEAARPSDGPEVTLVGAAAIQLHPLNARAVRGYLRDDAPGPVTRARWDPVLKLLGTQAPAGQALTTPLMVTLARTIYNPRPGEAATAIPDPAELCGLPSRAAVEAHLFDAFIPATHRPSAEGRWTAEQVERWLVFLARHLERTIGSPDLAWWQLQEVAPRTALSLAAGIVAGVVVGLVIGLTFGLVAGLALGVVAGIVAGLPAGPELPARGLRITAGGLRDEVVVGLAFGLVAGLALGVVAGLVAGLATGVVVGLTLGLVVGLATTLMTALVGIPPDLAEAVNPRMVLRHDRQATLFYTFLYGLAAGFTGGLAAWLTGGIAVGIAVGIVGWLTGGLMSGFASGMGETKWMSYMLVRGWLALRGQLPWPLMTFLADAHRRGVLRQAGAVYQFRHLELQHRLATRP